MRSTTKWWLTAATALATAGFALSAPGSALAADELDVCPSGCTYSTIQSAIDHAAAGDTVAVGAGIYDENVVVTRPT